MKTDQYSRCEELPITIRRHIYSFIIFFDKPGALILFGILILAAIPLPTWALALVVNNDTTVDSAAPDAILGTSKTLVIKNGSSSKHTFAKFDLAALPQATIITQATLRVFINRVVTPGALTVNVVSANWSERTLTNANAPAVIPLIPRPAPGTGTGIPQPSAPLVIAATDQQHYVDYDITTLVQDWQAKQQSNFGIALTPPIDGTLVNVTLDSKENNETSHPMEIEVAFEGPRGPQGSAGTPGTPGSSGISGYEIITASDTIASAFSNGIALTAVCSTGKKVLGGGCRVGSPLTQAIDSGPLDSQNGFFCHFNTGGINESISASAICANVQ